MGSILQIIIKLWISHLTRIVIDTNRSKSHTGIFVYLIILSLCIKEWGNSPGMSTMIALLPCLSQRKSNPLMSQGMNFQRFPARLITSPKLKTCLKCPNKVITLQTPKKTWACWTGVWRDLMLWKWPVQTHNRNPLGKIQGDQHLWQTLPTKQRTKSCSEGLVLT